MKRSLSEQVFVDRKNRELAALVQSSTDAIIGTTVDGLITSWNKAAEDQYGYSEEEVFGLNMSFCVPNDRKDEARHISGILEKGLNVSAMETKRQTKDGRLLDVSLSISPVFDSQGKVVGGVGIARDITKQKIAENELKESHKNLGEALLGFVDALAATVESRDYYTAEHQKRVTELAVAIARDAGLSKQDIAGLRMAAAIHDVGKIHVPAETLNKLSGVSPIEFGLIKTHAQAGYDIVKDIKFEHPISEIILQHHERMDGSGYPNGLKGKDIHGRAKILAIADVIEAMSSERPYREALGTEKALDEIEKNSGALYDPHFAAISLNLFRDKQFQFD